MQLESHPVSASPTRGSSFAIGLLATAHLANDAVTSMLPALLPSLAARCRLVPSELALLVCIFAISTALPQPLFGLFADKVGRRGVAAVGLGVSAALVAALGLVTSMPSLYAALIVGGLGSSALHPAGLGLVRATSSRNPGLAVAVFSSAGMAGGAVGPVLAIAVASAVGFEKLAWTAVPLLAIAALLARLGPKALPAPTGRPVVSGISLFKGPIAWLFVVALLCSIVMLTFMSAVPVWLVAERGITETSPLIGLTLGTFSLAAAAGGIGGGVLARSVEPSRLVVGSLVLSVVALESVFFTVPGSAPYVIAIAGAGTLLGFHGPLIIARAQELAPGAESAVAGFLVGTTWGVAGLVYAGFGLAQSVLGVGGTLTVVSLLGLPAAHLAAVTFRNLTQPNAARTCPASSCVHELPCCAEVAAA
jgi:FSR family fosmidomycin resistance protein-like MFS transporter